MTPQASADLCRVLHKVTTGTAVLVPSVRPDMSVQILPFNHRYCALLELTHQLPVCPRVLHAQVATCAQVGLLFKPVTMASTVLPILPHARIVLKATTAHLRLPILFYAQQVLVLQLDKRSAHHQLAGATQRPV